MLELQLSDSAVTGDQKKYQQIVREHSQVSKLHTLYTEYRAVLKKIEQNRELLREESGDHELAELAEAGD